MVKIVQIDWEKEAKTGQPEFDNVLRQIADPVTKSEFGTKELKSILENLQTAVNREFDGVAIAAPQIGIAKRIFLVKEKVYEEDDKKFKCQPTVFINPKITKRSRKKMEVDEGCLSVRPLYGTTERARNITIQAEDFHGQKFQMGAGGLLSHIFQHEIDHLDGILFIDHAKNIQEIDLAEEERIYQQELERSKNKLTENFL